MKVTHLELVAEVGSSTMEVVKMYFAGRLTRRELRSVLGEKKAGMVEQFEQEAACTWEETP